MKSIKRFGAALVALMLAAFSPLLGAESALGYMQRTGLASAFVLQNGNSFQPQVAGQKAIMEIPKYENALTRIQMRLGGTFTKAQIDELWVKIGTTAIWETNGTDLDKMMKYKGLFDDAYHLTVDFTERDMTDIVAKEIGGIDLGKLADSVFVEVKINAAAVNPTLAAKLFLTPPQGNDADQLVRKLVKFSTPQLGTSWQDVNYNPHGALVQRLYVFYTGTDWGAAADGNVKQIRVKKNAVPVFDEVNCLDNRFIQQEYRKTPQSRCFVVDFVVDNNASGALVTADAKSLVIQANLTAADTLTVYAEIMAKPYSV